MCSSDLAGGSGAGKTTIAQHLVDTIGGDVMTWLPYDAYYADLSAYAFAQRVQCNFDHPDAFDTDPFLDLCEDYDVTVKLEHRLPGRSILPATESVPTGAKSVTVKGTSTPTDSAYSAAATAALHSPFDEVEPHGGRPPRESR